MNVTCSLTMLAPHMVDGSPGAERNTKLSSVHFIRFGRVFFQPGSKSGLSEIYKPALLALILLRLSVPVIRLSVWPSTQSPFLIGYRNSHSLTFARTLL